MNEKVFLYVRVSTQEQANEGYSVKEQEDRLRNYAKSRGYTVVKVYVDGGHTGANIKRPALQEMIKNINKVDSVIVYKLDRLSRSQKDTLYLIEEVFLKNNVDFVSLSESFDTSTPFGRAMIGILSVFAQFEREQISERTLMGRTARARDGYYHGGDSTKAPTGYDYVDGELLINEYEALCVQYIFSEYLKGKGQATIFEEVEKKFPNVINHLSAIGKILKRSLYKGYVSFGGESYKGRHKPIVSSNDFDNAQLIINKRAAKFTNKSIEPYLLTGLMHCGHCGARLAGKTGKKLKNGNTLRYYVCYTRRGHPKHMMTAENCDKSFERKEVIEQRIIDRVKIISLADLESKEKEIESESRVGQLEEQVSKIDKQIANTVDLFSLGNIPIDILTNKVNDLNKQKESLLGHIEELNHEPVDLTEIKKIIPSLSDFDQWESGAQQVLLVKLIKSITVYNDKTLIDWAF